MEPSMKKIMLLPFLFALGHGYLQGNTINYDRLSFTMPSQVSEVSRTEQALILSHSTYKNQAQIIIYPSVRLPIVDFQGKLDRIAKTLNKGWTEEKNLLSQMGYTSQGHALAVRSQLMNTPKGKFLRILMGVSTGSNIQVAAIYSSDEGAAKALIGILTQALDKAQVVFPKGNAAPTSGPTREEHILQMHYDVPRNTAAAEAEKVSDLGYAYTSKDNSTEVIFRVNLQSTIAPDAQEALGRWLTFADFGQSKRARKSTWDLVETKDYQLPNGQRITRLGIREKYRGTYVTSKVGYMVYGKGWSVFIGTGVEYDRSEYQRREQILAKELMPMLEGIAASVSWKSEPRPNQQLTQYLINKKTYRYSFHYLSTGSMTFSSDKKESWDFYSDRTCKYDSDSFTGAISTELGLDGVTPSGNVYSSLEKNMKGDAWFQVISYQGVNVLQVQFKNYYTSLHLLEVDKSGQIHDQRFKGLAIDGKIEGVYHKGNGYYYRE
jgi:hypothetical protein